MTSVRSLRRIVRTLFVAGVALVSRDALAQTQSEPLITVIPGAYLDSVKKMRLGMNNPELFDPNTDISPVVTAVVISSALVQETGDFPIGSSSGGFSYSFDRASGTAIR